MQIENLTDTVEIPDEKLEFSTSKTHNLVKDIEYLKEWLIMGEYDVKNNTHLVKKKLKRLLDNINVPSTS